MCLLLSQNLIEINASTSSDAEPNEVHTKGNHTSIIQMIVVLVLFWQGQYEISSNAMVALFKLLKLLFIIIAKIMSLPVLNELANCIPLSLA